MLLTLRVTNYALIRSLQVDFSEGLNIITGETGAGKSILLGALGLLTGKRAEASAVNDELKCIIEGEFSISESLKKYFETEDLDFQNPSIIRREILPGGKSRAFINDTPVNLKILQELSTHLIDIHSQHEVFALADPEFRLSVTDSFGDAEKDAREFSEKYVAWLALKQEWEEHTKQTEQLRQEADYLTFRLKEIDDAALEPNEEAALDAELSTLSHAEEIKGSLFAGSALLESGEENILTQLARLIPAVQKVADFHPRLPELLSRIQSVNIELKDIAAEIEGIASDVEFNPQRLEWVNERLSLIQKLKNVHRITDFNMLIDIADSMRVKLKNLHVSDERSTELQVAMLSAEADLRKRAEKLHQKRLLGAENLQTKVAAHLLKLNMPHARFLVQLESLPDFTRSGSDRITFLFSANPGAEPQDLRKIASGGEMSRVMLALKSVIARLRNLPTLIFDEIDTGISGKTADLAGEMMRELAKDAQLMAITHLPQIAAKGNVHFKVMKEVKNNRTETSIVQLSMEERIEEVARMLSGDKLLPEAVSNAKALIGIS